MKSETATQAGSLHLKIKKVLLEDWDPIGIQGISEAQDEYDSYVAEIHAKLISRRPVDEVFDYLWRAETEHMGLAGNRLHTKAVADKLAELTVPC